MATRALIGYFDDDRVLTSTYNHYDGYPDHLGKMLDKYFSNEELAKKVAGTGYISYIDDDGNIESKNDMNPERTELGRDLDFDNLSRGERNRLILGLSWTFRDVWENLYHTINLLFIDELIDNGLDANGVENAISILKNMARERKKNIFLISHKDELQSRVNNVLTVVKENGYTSYANDVTII